MRSNVSRLGLLLICLCCCVRTGRAQQTGVAARITSNTTDATVFADSLALGRIGQQFFYIPAGARQIRLAPSFGESWSVEPVVVGMPPVSGDTLFLRLDFPHHYRLESTPYGAEAWIDDNGQARVVGKTPFTYVAETPVRSPITLRMDGFLPVEVRPDTSVWNRFSVALTPVDARSRAAAGGAVEGLPRRRYRWIDRAALGLAAASAAATVHYKFKADRRYDVYSAEGGEALKEEIRRYDTRAAIALGAMQVGVGVFTLRLALR